MLERRPCRGTALTPLSTEGSRNVEGSGTDAAYPGDEGYALVHPECDGVSWQGGPSMRMR